jgi:hypothetical protein
MRGCFTELHAVLTSCIYKKRNQPPPPLTLARRSTAKQTTQAFGLPAYPVVIRRREHECFESDRPLHVHICSSLSTDQKERTKFIHGTRYHGTCITVQHRNFGITTGVWPGFIILSACASYQQLATQSREWIYRFFHGVADARCRGFGNGPAANGG